MKKIIAGVVSVILLIGLVIYYFVACIGAKSSSGWDITKDLDYFNMSHRYGVVAEYRGDAKDIVIAVDSHEVGNVTELTRALRNYKAGDTATIKLIRSGKEMTLEITFDEKPQPQETVPQETVPKETVPKETWPDTTPQEPSQDEMPWWYEILPPYFWED